jgi:hypothetical protein
MKVHNFILFFVIFHFHGPFLAIKCGHFFFPLYFQTSFCSKNSLTVH